MKENKNSGKNPKRDTRQIAVGSVSVGGKSPVSVQTMTNTDSSDPEATLAQIKSVVEAGCEIIRVSVNSQKALAALEQICTGAMVPVVADIHFDYKLALGSLEYADAVRINPGNVGGIEKTLEVFAKAEELKRSIRIGVNSGSLEKDILAKYGSPTPEALAESALKNCEFIEKAGYRNFKISIKSSSVLSTIESNRFFAKRSDVPLHIGVTEAGSLLHGTARSGVGLGILLHEGIGDTIRVSLTADPAEEVRVGRTILSALGIRDDICNVVSCPMCARAGVDIEPVVREVEKVATKIRKNMTIAVMGCSVNGPGEAKEADCAVACFPGGGILFRKGVELRKVKADEIVESLLEVALDLASEGADS